jgi:hypothetical protein
MEQQMDYPDYHSQPLRLTSGDIKNPLPVIQRFFDNRSLIEHRELLWEVFSAAFGGSAADFLDGSQVSEWVFFHRSLEELMEAAWLMRLEGTSHVRKSTRQRKK